MQDFGLLIQREQDYIFDLENKLDYLYEKLEEAIKESTIEKISLEIDEISSAVDQSENLIEYYQNLSEEQGDYYYD